MQQPPERPRGTHLPVLRPARLIKHPHPALLPQEMSLEQPGEIATEDIARKATARLALSTTVPLLPRNGVDFDDDELLDLGAMNTVRLMQISSVMHAVRLSQPLRHTPSAPQNFYVPPPSFGRTVTPGSGDIAARHPYNTPQIASPPGMNQYQYTPPLSPLPQQAFSPTEPQTAQTLPTWRRILALPTVKIGLGLVIGIGLLFLIAHFVNFSATLAILRRRLTTPQGIIYALCAATAFIAAFSIRGVRWSFFLRRIQKVSPLKAIQIFWVAVFMNFLLPVQGGELVKSLLLKRTTGIPINQSLPTVAMDRSLDLLPALFIMALVPFLPGMHMNLALWLMLGLVSSILIGIIFVVALMAWNREVATRFISLVLGLLPRGIGAKIEGFALGFVDSLLAGASNPRTFIPAVALTGCAIMCDGLFAWMAFLTVGLTQMSFGTAIFGYTTYNMFSILPTPPGQVGSNETVGEIVFHNLLGFDKDHVLAMFVFSHPLAALIMTCLCFLCLAGLGLSFASVLKVRGSSKKKTLSRPLPSLVPATTPSPALSNVGNAEQYAHLPTMPLTPPGQSLPPLPPLRATPPSIAPTFPMPRSAGYPQMSPVIHYNDVPERQNRQ
jgi:uncharacterized protein (TIRG00374 family)